MFKELKQRIENGNSFFLYVVSSSGKKVSLVSQGRNKKEVKKNLKLKIQSKPEKYKNKDAILLYITFREPDNRYTFGDMLVNIISYKIENDLSIKSIDKDWIRYVTFTKEYINDEGWNNEYLHNIALATSNNLLKFNILSMPDYEYVESKLKN